MVRGDRIADPAKLGPVEFDLGFFSELLEIKRRIDGADRQAVGLCDVINLIGSNHRGGAWDVLNNDIRIPRNILGHEFSEHARIKIVGIAGFCADNDGDGFTLVKGRLRVGAGSRAKCD